MTDRAVSLASVAGGPATCRPRSGAAKLRGMLAERKAGSVVTGVEPPRSLMAASIFCFFSAKRWAYSDMPSFSSQSAICCIAPALVQASFGLVDQRVAGSEALASALPSFSSILLGRNKSDSPTPSDGFVFDPLGRFQPAQNEPTTASVRASIRRAGNEGES